MTFAIGFTTRSCLGSLTLCSGASEPLSSCTAAFGTVTTARCSRMLRIRREFWEAKIGRSRERNAEVREALHAVGWRSLTIWECAIRETRSP